MARRDVRQIVSLSLGHWLQALAGWIAKWASLVAAQGEHKDQAAGQTAAGTENKWRRDANGETGISRTEETIREPGQPPAHWVERLGDSGPPAHWLQWIRERTPGYPDVESTEFVHVSVPRQSPSVQGFPDRGARPASPEPRATSPSGLAGTSAAVGDDLQTADEDTTQGPDALYPQEAPVRRMHSTHTPTVQAQERTNASTRGNLGCRGLSNVIAPESAARERGNAAIRTRAGGGFGIWGQDRDRSLCLQKPTRATCPRASWARFLDDGCQVPWARQLDTGFAVLAPKRTPHL